ncbi:MAG: anthrone oxygenase family protein [Pseudomonadota bacterium]
MLRYVSWAVIGVALLLSAALFGFFYAWVCSTMWGLDTLDPRIAIAAMQAMNGSVRNAVFAPVFFGTPIALLLAVGVAYVQGARGAAAAFGLSAALTGLGGVVLTMVVHVPMNQGLAVIAIPDDLPAAAEIWTEYSPVWQVWNIIRTVFCGLAFVLALVGTVQTVRHQSGSGLSAN